MRRRDLAAGLFTAGLVLAASGQGADSLSLSSLTPPSGAIQGVDPGLGAAGLTAGHAVLATFQYVLESAKKAKIDVITQGVGGNDPHNGVSFPNTAEAGKGLRAVRWGVQCKAGPPASYSINFIRTVMTASATNKVLFDKAYPVKFRFVCEGAKARGGRVTPPTRSVPSGGASRGRRKAS
jgi:hypothetical protein